MGWGSGDTRSDHIRKPLLHPPELADARDQQQGQSCGEGFAYGQDFQLLQGQGLDLGGGGACEGAAAAVEEQPGVTAASPAWWHSASQ